MHLKKITFLFIFFCLVILQGCSVKKFIPEDELLYTGAKLELTSEDEIENEKKLKAELKQLLKPEPNSKILGSRIGLYFHYKAQKEKPGFITRFLNKKIGQEPVYLSDANPYNTEDLIKNRLENKGYFYSRAGHGVNQNEENKTASIDYRAVLPQNPYVLSKYQLDTDTLQVFKAIQEDIESSVLKENEPFNLTLMKAERERINAKLKKKGYYNFSSNFLVFEADTNQYDRKRFDLFLKLKDEVPEAGIKPYRIKNVNVYPNYQVGTDSIMADTVRYQNRNYIQEEVVFKPKKLDPFILLEEGDLYDPEKSGKTSRRLTGIGMYKFVNIRYDEIDSLANDSLGYLNANIFLSPMRKRALRAELQAVTKSNDFAGPHLTLTYSDRNLFEGGEILSISGKVGYEKQISGGKNKGQSSLVLGVDANLIFPRMIFPIIDIKSDWFKYSIPKTKIGAGFEFLDRSNLFSLFSVNGSFGYVWQANRFITHELDPFSVYYTQLSKTTAEFDKVLEDNPFLKQSFEQQFIAGLTYSFTFNGMVDNLATHQFYINSNVDLTGNFLDLLSSGENPKKFLGLEYAQYFKIDADVRYHLKFSQELILASRVYGGIGIPYGNSSVMPFSRQFFSGGPYSVRAFQIRSLGPGTYTPPGEDGLPYYDRMGNLRLEANIELRYPIYKFLKGAVFADAGNVWNTKGINDLSPEEEFTEQQKLLLEKGAFSSSFINELGIGIGTGLRVDIQSFVIRFDVGVPVHTPWLDEGERWEFRIKDPVLNFAIGYPF